VTPTQVFTGTNTGGIRLDRGSISCTGPERNCDDGWDNDCDGRADAADLDCTGKVPELCANGADDDGDGKTDCADLEDCGDRLACQRRPMTGATSTSLSAAR